MASSTDAQPPVATKTVKRMIATYTGPTQHTRILDRKTVNKSLMTAVTKDYVFSQENNFRQDVTGEPMEFLDYLKDTDPDFKLEEREVAADAIDDPA